MKVSNDVYLIFNQNTRLKRNNGIMVRIEDSVITAQILQEKLGNDKQVEICPRAKLTPSAHDFLRERSIEVFRRETSHSGSENSKNSSSTDFYKSTNFYSDS